MKLRGMERQDLESGWRLSRIAGWNQRREDWEFFFDSNPGGCFVVEDGQNVVGTVTTINYANKVGWVAMLLVDPAERRRGIGTRLLRRALEALSDCGCVKLDATPEGKLVYDGLGFIDEHHISRMTLSSAPPMIGAGVPRVRNMDERDLDLVDRLDGEAFGVKRTCVVKGLYALAPEYGAVAENDAGEAVGFCLGRHGHRFEHVGPIVGSDAEVAKAVARVAFARASGKPVLVDAALHTPAWITWLTSLGFVEQRRFIRMYRGARYHPGRFESTFAVSGPELG